MSNTDFDFDLSRASVDQQSLAVNGYGMVRIGPGDESLNVVFRWQPVINAAASRDAGRPIYERKAFVMINTPGEQLQIIDREVKDTDKARWPRQWDAFEKSQAFVPEGAPIELLFPTNPEIAMMLRQTGIHTIELCSRLTPHAIDTLGMGAQDWKTRATRYLESSKKGVEYHEIEKMKEAHTHETNALQNQINDLIQQIQALQSTMLSSAPQYMHSEVGRRTAVAHQTQPVKPLPRVQEWAKPAEGMVSDAPAETTPRRRGKQAEGDGVKFKD